jgi:protein involved in polysaccharide export with SLBB domain
MPNARFASAAIALALAAAAPLAAHAARPFTNIPYATWSDDDPLYRLYPGDEMDVAFPSAPELNKAVVVQPDGRITLPLVPPQMAAGRSAPELEQQLSAAYANQLLRPDVSITVRAQQLKVFVGGEVNKPGVYDMPGDIDALRAVIEAGGFADTGKRRQVVIIRRARDGHPMMRTVNLADALAGKPGAELVPLRRLDIVYVPKTPLAEITSVMVQIKNALPVEFSYAFTPLY